MRRLLAAAAAVLALATACSSSDPTAPATGAPSTVEVPTAAGSVVPTEITFRTYQLDRGVRVHARTVPGRTDAPWAVYVHGGGWRTGRGDSDIGDTWARHVVPRGFQVFAIDYRLSQVASWPAPRDDVARDVDWIRAHARTFGIDVRRGVVVGESAGGHLASIEASRGTFAGAVDLAGVVDPQAALDAPMAALGQAATQMVGCDVRVCPARWRDTRAITHVGARTPPILVLHSADDPIVPVSMSTTFAAQLRAAGKQVTFTVVPGPAHSMLGIPAVLTQIDAFMDAVTR